jgi:hypothetical protein
MKRHVAEAAIAVSLLAAGALRAAAGSASPTLESSLKGLARQEKNIEVRIALNDLDVDLRRSEEYARSALSTDVESYKRARYRGAVGDLGTARTKLAQIETLGGPNYPSLLEAEKVFEDARARILAILAPLREAYLPEVKAPPDLYTGGDRGRIESAIRKAWKQAWPGDDIIAIRFHAAAWQREKTRRWNDAEKAWAYADVSALPMTVIVRTDEKIATKFVAYMNKDNDTGELSPGVHTKAGGYLVEEMLIANISK